MADSSASENTSVDPYFEFLCQPNRQSLYSKLAKPPSCPIRFASNVRQLLVDCFEHPPLGVFIDLPTQLALGSANVDLVFDFHTKWPVIRCNILDSGESTATCHEPERTDSLPGALEALAANDPRWFTTGFERNVLRLELAFRTRVRAGSGDWRRGQTLNVSAQGIFIVNFDDVEPDTPLEVELHDLTPSPLKLAGWVRWMSPWKSLPHQPGIGVHLQTCAQTRSFVEGIVQQQLQYDDVFLRKAPKATRAA